MESQLPRYRATFNSDRISPVLGYPIIVGTRRQPVGTMVSIAVQKPENEGGGLVIMTETEARAMMQTLQSLLAHG